MSKPKMSDILELSIPERIQLVQDIWDTIAEGPDSVELTEEQKQELDRRLEMIKADPNCGQSWDEVRAKIGL